MSRVFLAAERSQPLSQMARTGLANALTQCWADPRLRSHEGRLSRTFLAAANDAIRQTTAAPHSSIRWFNGMPALLSEVIGAPTLGHRLVISDTQREQVRRLARTEWPQHQFVLCDETGRMDTEQLTQLLRPNDVLLAMAAIEELGNLEDLAAIATAAQAAEVPLLVDASMLTGHLPLPFPDLWQQLFLSAHSWAGGNDIAVQVINDGQRRDLLADDTPAVPRIAAAALSLETSLAEQHQRAELDRRALTQVRQQLQPLSGIEFHTCEPALPHVLSFSLLYVDAEVLLDELDRAGFAVASGSACVSEAHQPSLVLQQLGKLTSGNVRITLPLDLNHAALADFAPALMSILGRLRQEHESMSAPEAHGVAQFPADAAAGHIDNDPWRSAQLHLDEIGHPCPAPIIALGRAGRTHPNAVITLAADDPAVVTDVAAWSRLTGGKVLAQQQQHTIHHFLLQLPAKQR